MDNGVSGVPTVADRKKMLGIVERPGDIKEQGNWRVNKKPPPIKESLQTSTPPRIRERSPSFVKIVGGFFKRSSPAPKPASMNSEPPAFSFESTTPASTVSSEYQLSTCSDSSFLQGEWTSDFSELKQLLENENVPIFSGYVLLVQEGENVSAIKIAPRYMQLWLFAEKYAKEESLHIVTYLEESKTSTSEEKLLSKLEIAEPSKCFVISQSQMEAGILRIKIPTEAEIKDALINDFHFQTQFMNFKHYGLEEVRKALNLPR